MTDDIKADIARARKIGAASVPSDFGPLAVTPPAVITRLADHCERLLVRVGKLEASLKGVIMLFERERAFLKLVRGWSAPIEVRDALDAAAMLLSEPPG